MGGDFVKDLGHFEFVLRRGDKRVCIVCIVEAKKDNMEQGMVQALLDCEVAAEIGDLDTVWYCYQLSPMEECVLNLGKEELAQASLLEITEKIYAMLSDE